MMTLPRRLTPWANRFRKDFEITYSPTAFANPNVRLLSLIIFKDKHSSILSAWVCAHCGYVEFYADSPAALKLPNPPDH
jgi:hypothetical protein